MNELLFSLLERVESDDEIFEQVQASQTKDNLNGIEEYNYLTLLDGGERHSLAP